MEYRILQYQDQTKYVLYNIQYLKECFQISTAVHSLRIQQPIPKKGIRKIHIYEFYDQL